MRYLFTVVALTLASFVSFPAQSLREAAKKLGGAADNTFNAEFQQRSRDELVSASDVIVRARISGIRTLLIEDDALVATEYDFIPLQMIRQVNAQRSAARPGAMPPLTVRRIGGRMTEGPYRYSTINHDFPESEALKIDDEAILFLQFDPATGGYAFTDGPFGVFRVANDKVLPLTRLVAKLRDDQPVETKDFIADLQRRASKVR